MNYTPTDWTSEVASSMEHLDILLRQFLRREKAGALIEIAYADPVPYSNLVAAASKGLTDYFLCRADLEGPALIEMADRIAKENKAKRQLRRAEFHENADDVTSTNPIKSAFEIGPGDGTKIEKILESKLKTDLKNIGLIDKQVEFSNAARRRIKKINPDTHVTQISQDIFSEARRHKFSSTVLGMVLGGTINNVVIDGFPNDDTEYPHSKFVEIFDILSAYFSEEEGGDLVVSTDGSDLTTMLNGYRDRLGTTHNAEFNINALEMIEKSFLEASRLIPDSKHYKITITSEDPRLKGKDQITFRDIMRPDTKYFSKSQLAGHCLVCDFPATVTIGDPNHGGETINLSSGWYNATIISAKPRASQLVDAAEETQKFRYKDSTVSEELVPGLLTREAKRIEVLRFHFETVSPDQSLAPIKDAATEKPSPLRQIKEALAIIPSPNNQWALLANR